jgi:hypothetical protein
MAKRRADRESGATAEQKIEETIESTNKLVKLIEERRVRICVCTCVCVCLDGLPGKLLLN